MDENSLHGLERVTQRSSSIPPNFSNAGGNYNEDYHTHVRRRVSTISQMYLPNGNEYYPQKRLPPTGPEGPQSFLFETVNDGSITGIRRQASIVTPISPKEEKYLDKRTRQILFLLEPILSGVILFPIIVLFWEAGWNLAIIVLDSLNNSPNDSNSSLIFDEDTPTYTWQSLICPYFIVQLILLAYYLCQDLIYDFLKTKKWFLQVILLKCHIGLLATLYIIQWVMLWTMWDEYIPHDWYFELSLSFMALFAFIVVNGHLSDLVCSPFLFSYDSIEYCIHFGCPLLTREMKQWKINLINFVSYEIIVSNLAVMSWRGFYHCVDDYLYPDADDADKSMIVSFLVGYLLYFPLMYFQKYFEDLRAKYEFWTFVSINYPQFYRNIRHLLAFLSCIFTWRGYWMLYDNYINIYGGDYYGRNSLLCFFGSFLVLSILQTASSINGPMNSMDDQHNFFPLYPHCYVSLVHSKLSQYFSKEQIQRLIINQ